MSELLNQAVLWTGRSTSTLYLQAGDFSSTILEQIDVQSLSSPPTNGVYGISWDGNNTLFAGLDASSGFPRAYLMSGQFSGSIVASLDMNAETTSIFPLSSNRNKDTLITSPLTGELKRLSGQFTTTVLSEVDMSGTALFPNDISADNDGNALWMGFDTKFIYRQSSQFTTTVKDSIDVSGITISGRGCSWDGQDVLFCDGTQLYKLSGRFTTTVLLSLTTTVAPTNIETNQWANRLGIGSRPGAVLRSRKGFFTPLPMGAPPQPDPIINPGLLAIRFAHPMPPPMGLLRRRSILTTPIPDVLIFTTYTQTLSQRFRVPDVAIDLYALYVGADAAADLTAAPDATSATLPFSYGLAAATPGNTIVYHLIVLKRNQYNMLSLNRFERFVEIDENGDEVAIPPSEAVNVTLTDAGEGVGLLKASYLKRVDIDNTADAWNIYSTTNGVDPDPALDTPTEVAMSTLFPVEHLFHQFTGLGDATDLRVILRTLNNPSTESSSTTVLQVTISTDGPTTEGPAGVFLGTDEGQR